MNEKSLGNIEMRTWFTLKINEATGNGVLVLVMAVPGCSGFRKDLTNISTFSKWTHAQWKKIAMKCMFID